MTLQEAFNIADEKIRTQQLEIERLRCENARLDEFIKRARNFSIFQDHQTEVMQLQEEIKRLQHLITTMQISRDTIDEAYDKQDWENQRLQDEVEQLKRFIDRLSEALEPYAGPDSTGLVDLYATQLVKDAGRLKGWRTNDEQIDRLNAEIERMREQQRSDTRLLDERDAEIARLTEQNKELDLGMKEATTTIFDQIAELSRKKGEIEELTNFISACRFAGPDRTRNA